MTAPKATNEKAYKYDIAFSLLEKDLSMAREINELLADRYSTFLYIDRQNEIAGTDGEIKFKEVFSKEARIVVVFYREGWGKTTWTRIEEEAIRDRAYHEGYDFVKYIPLDNPPTTPIYLPKVQIWLNIHAYGTKGVAAVIEARLTELGVVKHKETVLEKVARQGREAAFEAAKKKYRDSPFAIDDADESFVEMTKSLYESVSRINEIGSLGTLEFKAHPRIAIVLGLREALKVEWKLAYRNTLEGAVLEMSLWSGHPPTPIWVPYDESYMSKNQKLKFEFMGDGGAWVGRDGLTYDSSALAEYALHYLLDSNNGGETSVLFYGL